MGNVKQYIYKFWYNFNHSIITAILVAVGCLFGYGLDTLLVVGGFWLGREHSQAEYRYMKLKGINRSKLGLFDGFRLEVWDRDSFLKDLMIPIIVGLLTICIQILFSVDYYRVCNI